TVGGVHPPRRRRAARTRERYREHPCRCAPETRERTRVRALDDFSTFAVRVHKPRVTVVQQRIRCVRCGSMKADSAGMLVPFVCRTDARKRTKRPLAGALSSRQVIRVCWLLDPRRLFRFEFGDFRNNSFAAGPGDRLQMYELSITRTDHSGRMAGECNRPV